MIRIFIVLLMLCFVITAAAQQRERISCEVVYIVDGDTFDCLIKDQTQRVRLIGMDTPEKNTDEGKAAAKYVENIMPVGTTVELELDVAGTRRSSRTHMQSQQY